MADTMANGIRNCLSLFWYWHSNPVLSHVLASPGPSCPVLFFVCLFVYFTFPIILYPVSYPITFPFLFSSYSVLSLIIIYCFQAYIFYPILFQDRIPSYCLFCPILSPVLSQIVYPILVGCIRKCLLQSLAPRKVNTLWLGLVILYHVLSSILYSALSQHFFIIFCSISQSILSLLYPAVFCPAPPALSYLSPLHISTV